MCDASDFAVGAVLGQRIDGKFKQIFYASKTLNNAQEHYTATEKEFLAVVFSFDKFHPYLILLKTVVYTNDSTLTYLFSKQDAKPTLIRWVMLLSGFDIKIKDKKGAENLAADHLSRLENPDLGPNDDEPWGHHSASITGRKVYESGFFWPSIFKDAKDYVMRCDACQRLGNISSRSEMPQNNIQSSVGYNPKDSFEKLNDALWAFRTTYKTPTGSKNHFMELNELMELRDGAYENTQIYKERTKKWDDSRLQGDKDFKVGDKVLLFNSRLRMHLEITDKNGISFKVNGQSLKKYYDGHIDTEGKEVVEFEEDTTLSSQTSIQRIRSIPCGALNVWTLSVLYVSAFKTLLSVLSIRIPEIVMLASRHITTHILTHKLNMENHT
ncbi:reverse transcriptase domain-containing protein [Tanacetum coccineum]